MRPEHIELLLSPGTPTVSPDGTTAVVAVSHPSLDADTYVGQLLRIEVDAESPGTPRRLTQGKSDSSPKYSPDGRLIGFLRGGDGAPQLAIMPADGGEARVVTDRHLGVSDFAFAPDSRGVVVVSREPEEGRYGTLDGVDAGAEDPRLITGHRYQANGLGYTNDRPAQLFFLELPDLDAEPPVAPVGRAKKRQVDDGEKTSLTPGLTQLTYDGVDHSNPVFSPDGQTVYFVASSHETHDEDLRAGVYAVGRDGGEPRLVSGVLPDLSMSSVAVHPDGNALYALGADVGPTGLDFVARNEALYLLPLDGSEATRLTDPETVEPAHADVVVDDDGAVLLITSSRGRGELLKVTEQGTTTLHSDEDVVTGVDSAAGRIVVTVATKDSMGEIAEVTADGLQMLTDFGAVLREQTSLITPTELEITARDGYPVHGWVLVPEGPGPHPVLLNIHGGPYSQYGWDLFDEAQVYASAGYAVVMCNPRGASGYGQEHGRVIRQAMGTVDASDILDFLDGALNAEPSLDRERVGVMGGSYGGYMTAWLIGHEHRFAGAVVERGYLDPEGFVGPSDIGWFFSDYVGDDPELIASQSPLAVADQVRTPTLVLHSEDDLRCPLSQAQRYYEKLLSAGVDARLLIFPGENHELSRSGRPHHRLQRFTAILDWWNERLPV